MQAKTIVVSAVNLRKGGTLKILRQCLEYLSERDDVHTIALVHDKSLCDYPGIEYMEIPWTTKTWLHRLWCEYVTMHKISLRMADERGGDPVDVWLSLHDTTPRVVAKKREVYCHTSFPFLKLKLRDFLMDPKIPLFAMFTRFAYAVGVHHNDSLIVQQEWFADAMSRMLRVDRTKFRVIPPQESEAVRVADSDRDESLFLFVSTPDCHKNFETLCEAARILESEGLSFRVVLTMKGDENRYAKWIYRHWGTVRSIDFHGLMGKEELYGYYAKAGTFVFPSRVETWGLPISEYMKANSGGRLLLADLPYARETSRGATRVAFFKATDAHSLACEMKTILTK